SIVAFAKPLDSATTVYLPGGRSGMVYRPSSLALAVRTRPVSLFVTVTLAFATAAPFVSTTCPEIWPVLACDCANALTAHRASTVSEAKQNRRNLFITGELLRKSNLFQTNMRAAARHMLTKST